MVDDAISRALEAIEPYVKQGYTVHQDDEWGGDLGVKEQKAIAHPLFEENDYWFSMGTDVDNARVAIQVYDNKGRVVTLTHGRTPDCRCASVYPDSSHLLHRC
jgi:hypothetical protein